MSIENLLTRAPVVHAPALAEDVADRFTDSPQPLQDLVAGMAGTSSYLRGLLLRETDWFQSAVKKEPDQVFADAIADVDIADDAGLAQQLRQAKRRIALFLATVDLGGVWPLEKVTTALTKFAEFAVDTALRSQVRVMISRKKLPGCGPDDIIDCAGITALAMGKMGAYELNYSSDIDLIMLFDESRHNADNFDEIRMAFQRITRNMAKMLSDATADGYVFRTDLRLRPNPSVTPVCVPMDAAERYYESEGRTWERAAFIKARACAGDIAAGKAFLKRLTPFVWRKHLDFTAIQDAHDMRLRIREHKGLGGGISVPGHDMKLGRGGIREIEFFAQTQQLIAGGRDPSLRSANTLKALAALVEKDWVPAETAQILTDAYRAHRTTEHRIQMLRDAQTHVVPASDDGVAQLAHLAGWPDVDGFIADQQARLEQVQTEIEKFFAPLSGEDTDDSPVLSEGMEEQIDSWVGLPALKTKRAVDIFERLRPEISRRIAAATRPDFTLNQLDEFIRRLPAGVQLFSLFEANPQILDLLLDICSTAPSLSVYLSRNTAVFDAVLSGQFFEPLPDYAGYLSDLKKALAEVVDYEDVLNTTRRWQKEQHFRIGVLMLRRLAGLEEVEQAYSDLAQAVLQGVLPWVEQDVIRRYGRFSRQDISILGMGKLGSRQMTATSDLDLILIYDVDGDMADGRRGLAPAQYFARLTQSMIIALSSPMADGVLYEVDMRLRPSGRQGPVATALSAFETYQLNEAWTWEHLALTRARVVAGSAEQAAKLDQIRSHILERPRERADVVADVVAMRDRLSAAKGTSASVWKVKDLAGGILNIELVAQMLGLLAHSDARDPRMQIEQALGQEGAALIETHKMLCTVQQAQRLVMEGAFDPAKLGRDGVDFVLAFTGSETLETLEAAILQETQAAAAEIVRILT